MEPDLFIRGNILFADNAVLKTTDGVNTTIVAGNSEKSGYKNGQNALFYPLNSFTQISQSHIVASDTWNNCLRLINRETGETSRYAGRCEYSGYKDGTIEAQFNSPKGIIIDLKQNGFLFVADSQNKAIRYVEISPSSIQPVPVTTFHKLSDIDWIGYVAQDPETGNLFITTKLKVHQLTYVSNSLSEVAVSQAPGPSEPVSANFFKEIIFMESKTLLIADRSNHTVRIFDIASNNTYLMCKGSEGHTNGNWKTCLLDRPSSLMILNSTLFIGGFKWIKIIQGEEFLGSTLKLMFSFLNATTMNHLKPYFKTKQIGLMRLFGNLFGIRQYPYVVKS